MLLANSVDAAEKLFRERNWPIGKLFELLGDHFIGLWRFRVVGESRGYCCTYQFMGSYYDTRDEPTMVRALLKALMGLNLLLTQHNLPPIHVPGDTPFVPIFSCRSRL